MSLHSQIGDLRRQVLSSMFRRTAMLGDLGPIVSFTFDDFPRSALASGGEILERFGVRATYYVAMGLMGTQNNLGEQFLPTDLHSLIERGHELASHSFGHRSARKTPMSAFLKDVEQGAKAIQENIGISPSNSFAYPYGEVTLAVKGRLGPRMGSCRGTIGGLNGPAVDLNLLRSNRLYGDVDQLDAAQRLILENEKRRNWLIFYTHDVAANPSPYGCTPALLEEAVSFAVKRGARIRTVADVVSDLSGA